MPVAWSCSSVLFLTTLRIHCLLFKWSTFEISKCIYQYPCSLLIRVLLLHLLSQTPNCAYFSDKRVNLGNVKRFPQNHTASERYSQHEFHKSHALSTLQPVPPVPKHTRSKGLGKGQEMPAHRYRNAETVIL